MAGIQKTNAARLLDKAKIPYELVPYTVDENNLAADHVAEEVGMTLNIGQLLSLPLIALGIYLIWKSRTARELPVTYKK